MKSVLPIDISGSVPSSADESDDSNITDWALGEFHKRYGTHITKDDVWEYVYGVMHAPDWRERYRHDLQRNLPRIPLADDFEAFRVAGRELMNLHVGYETVEEWPLECQVDGKPVRFVDGKFVAESADKLIAEEAVVLDENVFCIEKRMAWAKEGRKQVRSTLMINSRCALVGIPDEAHEYTVSGRSPLQWAIDSVRFKLDKTSGITDDPNMCEAWADTPFNLIRHLRRLVYMSVATTRIVASLPPSLNEPQESEQGSEPEEPESSSN